LEKDFEGKNVAFYFCCEGGENPKMENTEINQKKLLTKNMSLKPMTLLLLEVV
jgi:hypothetical protein